MAKLNGSMAAGFELSPDGSKYCDQLAGDTDGMITVYSVGGWEKPLSVCWLFGFLILLFCILKGK